MFGKKKFKHKKDNMYDACGVDKKSYKMKLRKLNKYIKKINTSERDDEKFVYRSMIVEKADDLFSKRELALLVFQLNHFLTKEIEEKESDDKPHPEFG